MLEKIRNKCLIFLWTRKREREGIPLMKRKKLVKTKEVGVWELKNIHHFGQDLQGRNYEV